MLYGIPVYITNLLHCDGSPIIGEGIYTQRRKEEGVDTESFPHQTGSQQIHLNSTTPRTPAKRRKKH